MSRNINRCIVVAIALLCAIMCCTALGESADQLLRSKFGTPQTNTDADYVKEYDEGLTIYFFPDEGSVIILKTSSYATSLYAWQTPASYNITNLLADEKSSFSSLNIILINMETQQVLQYPATFTSSLAKTAIKTSDYSDLVNKSNEMITGNSITGGDNKYQSSVTAPFTIWTDRQPTYIRTSPSAEDQSNVKISVDANEQYKAYGTVSGNKNPWYIVYIDGQKCYISTQNAKPYKPFTAWNTTKWYDEKQQIKDAALMRENGKRTVYLYYRNDTGATKWFDKKADYIVDNGVTWYLKGNGSPKTQYQYKTRERIVK